MIKNILPSKSGNAENANKIIKTVKKLCKSCAHGWQGFAKGVL